ncbi:MAG: hypothetical protein EA427_16175 [Spirochaetaceae bacterium]|nr:MAG: hypothetical protein EA427_16175 [Spirochaetaceae bacterium]
MSTYRFIETAREFSAYRGQLEQRHVGIVALDLEAEFNLHVYGEHFCLLQIHDGTEAVLVDPQAVPVEAIGAFLEDRDILKITYDSAGDRGLLFRNHGIRMRSLLDLRPAVDLLNYEKQGLSSVLESALGHTPGPGKKRYQQYNWMRRPIDPGAVEYAIGDVLHLFELKDHLLEELRRGGLLERYILENLKVQDQDPETGRKAGFLRTGRFRKLPRPRQEHLEEIHAVRERYARELNLPPNSVLPNGALFEIVQGSQDLESLRPARGVPRGTFEAMLREIRERGRISGEGGASGSRS